MGIRAQMQSNRLAMMKFMKKPSILIACLLLLACAMGLFWLYNTGMIGTHTFNALFSKAPHSKENPYNGTYHYDIDKVENNKIRHSLEIEQKNGYDPLTLVINNDTASLLGYQLHSAVKPRFFSVCVKDDSLLLKPLLTPSPANICDKPDSDDYYLTLQPSADGGLFCANCEDFEFPRYWRTTTK